MDMNIEKYKDILKNISKSELAIRNRAKEVHADTNQIYGLGHEYAYHLNQVAYILVHYLYEIADHEDDVLPVIFAAYFHDSIEDARLTYNDVMKIAKEYMSQEQARLATEIVYALTNEKGRNREERANEKYYKGIRVTPYAAIVKASDRLANYEYAKSEEGKESMKKAYTKEMDHFIESITYNTTEYVDVDFLFRGYPEKTHTIPQGMIDRLKQSK